MKRRLAFFAVLVSLLLMSATAKAQPKAVGARFGWVVEGSYQHTLGSGFLELGVGIPGYDAGIALDGTYNWVAYRNTTSKKDCIEFFLGVGCGLHTYFSTYSRNLDGTYSYYENPRVCSGPVGNIGVQYQFSIPIQVGISWRPMFGGRFTSEEARFYKEGLCDVGIAFRYVF